MFRVKSDWKYPVGAGPLEICGGIRFPEVQIFLV